MHSQNLLGDVLGDVGDPTGRVLRRSMQMIQQRGRGAIVYLRHEGMGKGLLKRLQTLHDLAHHPPRDATGLRSGPGDYGIGSQILRDLGIRKLQLLTNHPVHPTALSGFGLEISEFVPVEVE
jgi:3,4-dihydroxy 2-butanone 4-phosphate synthase/GTP cyclohydrolase II